MTLRRSARLAFAFAWTLSGCSSDDVGSAGNDDGGLRPDGATSSDGEASIDGARTDGGGGGPVDSIGWAEQQAKPTFDFHFRATTAPSPTETTATLTAGGVVPIVGDWDGDGIDTMSAYDPVTSTFYLRDSNTTGSSTTTRQFGVGGVGSLPVHGDWDKSGKDSLGVFDPTSNTFHLQIKGADTSFVFGASDAGISFPLAGDWDGDGIDTVGLYGFSEGVYFLKNSNDANPATSITPFTFGVGGGFPIAGDWDGDGIDTIGFYSAPSYVLRNTNTPGAADLTVSYGTPGSTAIAGRWVN